MTKFWIFVSGLIVGLLFLNFTGFIGASTGRYQFSTTGSSVIDTQTGIIKILRLNTPFDDYDK